MMEKETVQIKGDALPKDKKKFRSLLIAILLLSAVSFWTGYSKGKSSQAGNGGVPLMQSVIENKNGSDQAVDFALFWKVWDLVKQKYVNNASLDAQKMVYGAIEGMLKATGDPYTNFFNPKDTKSFSQDMEGSFDGIGAELGIKDKILTVIAPLEDSPSAKAGLRSGDKIISIDEKPSLDMSIDEAVENIRGKKGTAVTLVVLHQGDQETKSISITRDTILIKSVKLEFKENGIAVLKLTKFGETTVKEFDAAVNQITSKNTRGIVLDLRNNPGGFLEKSVAIASRMIPKGKIVLMEENNAGQRDTLYTTGGNKLSGIPMVILINEGSASASEILAGALKDNLGITLIGKKSFGKGSVQELIELPGGTSVKITVAKWLTPNGEYIMEKGINPDIEVEMTFEDYENSRDPQLEKAMEEIKKEIEK